MSDEQRYTAAAYDLALTARRNRERAERAEAELAKAVTLDDFMEYQRNAASQREAAEAERDALRGALARNQDQWEKARTNGVTVPLSLIEANRALLSPGTPEPGATP